MKCKQNSVGDIVKYKDRLCVSGHKSIEFVNYWETDSPIIFLDIIRMIFTLAIVNKWHITISISIAYSIKGGYFHDIDGSLPPF